MSNIKAGAMDKGVLGIETDVLYQWRNLVPTYERRLTPISDVYMTDVQAGSVDFVSRILAEEELPVENVQLERISVDSIRDEELIHQNVNDFKLLKQ